MAGTARDAHRWPQNSGGPSTHRCESEQSTFPFPLVAEAVLCMSLSQGCTAEYRTVLVWSTTDTRADPAAHTVRIAALQNALPPTNYEHPPYPPAYVDLSRLSVCQSWLSIGLRKKAPGQMSPETDASIKSAHQ